tara:strand:- start:6659 stop:7327 length:669 start_codon:yes stop_codon:yes gene_type:complete
MNVGEVTALFRDYIDEADTTFVTDSNVQQYLKIGYDRFRKAVNSVDEMRFAKEYDVTLSGKSLSLDGTLMGSGAPAATRLQSIVALTELDSNDFPACEYIAVSRPKELASHGNRRSGPHVPRYYLRDRVLQFDVELSSKVRITYIPYQNVDWTNSSGYIDDIEQFHDLIALYAHSNYAIRDGEINEPLRILLEDRKVEFREYLMEGMSRNYSSSVHDDPDWL